MVTTVDKNIAVATKLGSFAMEQVVAGHFDNTEVLAKTKVGIDISDDATTTTTTNSNCTHE